MQILYYHETRQRVEEEEAAEGEQEAGEESPEVRNIDQFYIYISKFYLQRGQHGPLQEGGFEK